ncbi:MAG: flagellar basal body rod protein FlgC [Lentisphaeraceae bacterium]|nr:flagellar basal body rod protein FlgC [Lentisphaeraceae bacterium]
MGYELIPAASISSSGLRAETLRMEVAANNIANAQTTSPNGKNLYQRKVVVFESVLKDQFNRNSFNSFGGVNVKEVVASNKQPIEIFNPSHPHADENGMLLKPNISPLEEMVDMMTATRAYEANLTLMKESKKMAEKTIQLGGQG